MRKTLSMLLVTLALGCSRKAATTTMPDMAHATTDLAPAARDMTSTAMLPQPAWIGSGGSAKATTQRLNLNSGGTDTVGSAPSTSSGSKASFTPGAFSSLTQ
jgi:hypothetical protein